MHLLCFGFGYVAQQLAHTILAYYGKVSGTSRDLLQAKTWAQKGIKISLFSSQHLLSREVFKDITHMLVSIPPEGNYDPVLLYHHEDLLRLRHLQWVGYLSTTGVYGDHQGAWVTEDTPCNPTSERDLVRLKIENSWLESALPVHIFRLSGIYGPQRCVFDQLAHGLARCIDKPGHLFSRIHVEDIAQTLYASMQLPHPGSIYNLADNYPASAKEVIEYACQLLKCDPPPLIPYEKADLSPMAMRFYRDNRKICNTKIKQHLMIQLFYPSYYEGLKALFPAYYPTKDSI